MGKYREKEYGGETRKMEEINRERKKEWRIEMFNVRPYTIR